MSCVSARNGRGGVGNEAMESPIITRHRERQTDTHTHTGSDETLVVENGATIIKVEDLVVVIDGDNLGVGDESNTGLVRGHKLLCSLEELGVAEKHAAQEKGRTRVCA